MSNLIVVDMQEKFYSANVHWMRKNSLEIINRAKIDDANIIFLEFFGHGPTIKELKDAVKEHEKVWTLYKDCDDGGEHVISLIDHLELKSDRFDFIGVNLCACVLETTKTLTEHFKSSEFYLHEKAANTCRSCEKKKDLESYTHLEII